MVTKSLPMESPEKNLGEIENYAQNGFAVLNNVFSKDEIGALKNEAPRICRENFGSLPGLPDDSKRLTDDELISRVLCIHYPHKISDLIFKTLSHPVLVKVLTRVIGPNVKCLQSMLFIKSEGKPGQAWHQDEFYLPTRDRSLTGAWIALDDATVDNGCLWVIPGSHRSGVIWPQKKQNDQRFDCSGEAFQFPYTQEDSVPVEVKAGSLVVFNGYLLHRSFPNRGKTGPRRALVNHFMSAESLLPLFPAKASEDLQSGEIDFRDIVMVAGKDPYAYKGMEEKSLPHVRPDGRGGCAKYLAKKMEGRFLATE